MQPYKGQLPLVVNHDVQAEHWIGLSLQHLNDLKLVEMERIAVQIPCKHTYEEVSGRLSISPCLNVQV